VLNNTFWALSVPRGHVTRRVRIANFAIKMAHSHCVHLLLSNGSSKMHKIWQ